MSMPPFTRRGFTFSVLSVPFWSLSAKAMKPHQAVISDFGAKADGSTVNTKAIQSVIDDCAAKGGGTVVVPSGVFVSGALFLKPGVNLHLEKNAVLKCSTDMANFPRQRTRIEGQYNESFNPALINADGCDGLKITGEGTLDGAGRPIWDLFWKLRGEASDPASFPNLSVDRARLALIENSKNVSVEGVTFKDSQFWNLHLYKCQHVLVRNARFEVPDDYEQAPSSDGIDLDSCQNVLVDGCYFSVTDDCIAAKGSKGPLAMQDKNSPPVEHIRVRNCHFKRGHQAFSCGSEATIIRDVIIEDCKLTGALNLLMLKLRPDTPQRYEDIHLRNITLDNAGGRIMLIEPWAQYKNLQGEAPPQSTVRNITFSDIKGRFGSFGIVRPNPGQTAISDITVSRIDVQLEKEPELMVSGATNIRFEQVSVNGKTVKEPTQGAVPLPEGGFRVSG